MRPLLIMQSYSRVSKSCGEIKSKDQSWIDCSNQPEQQRSGNDGSGNRSMVFFRHEIISCHRIRLGDAIIYI